MCPRPFLQNGTGSWHCGFFLHLPHGAKRQVQRTSLKSLGTQKKEHILVSSRNQRTLGVGASNLVSGGSSACDGCGSQSSTETWGCNSLHEGRPARNLELTLDSERMKERQLLRTRGSMFKEVSASLPAIHQAEAPSRAVRKGANAFASKDCLSLPEIYEDGFQIPITANKETHD